MATTKDENTKDMKDYEVNYLVDPQLDETQREALNTAIDAKIAELEGKVNHAPATIRKKLAYPVDGKYSVFFRTLHTSLPAGAINELHEMMRREATVLRAQILQTTWREPINIDELFAPEKDKADKTSKTKSPKKPVEMQDVEAGIAKALEEEVK